MTEARCVGWIHVGVDAADEREIEALVLNDAALGRVFTDREIVRCRAFGQGARAAFARCFAAKEAVLKAARIEGATVREIEIHWASDGAPRVHWPRLVEDGMHISVSTSSSGTLALAVAVACPGREDRE